MSLSYRRFYLLLLHYQDADCSILCNECMAMIVTKIPVGCTCIGKTTLHTNSNIPQVCMRESTNQLFLQTLGPRGFTETFL